MHVTLDILCLTLPPEVDLAVSNSRPCYNRMTSFTSQVSYASMSPTTNDKDDGFSFISTTDGGLVKMFTLHSLFMMGGGRQKRMSNFLIKM